MVTDNAAYIGHSQIYYYFNSILFSIPQLYCALQLNFLYFMLLGTSNWSGDYFINTAGVSCIVNQTTNTTMPNYNNTIQEQLKLIFERDWNSNYSHIL